MKGVQVENLLFYWFFCASIDVGRFFFKQYASGLESPNLLRILQFNFSYETDFEPTVLLLKKTARCQPFLAMLRCLFHKHLRFKRSSLLRGDSKRASLFFTEILTPPGSSRCPFKSFFERKIPTFSGVRY